MIIVEPLAGLASLYLSLKQPERALQRIDRQIQLAPSTAKPYELQGQIYASQKDYTKAEESYRKAISIDNAKLLEQGDS